MPPGRTEELTFWSAFLGGKPTDTAMQPEAILETVLYADDLSAAEAFYTGVLNLDMVAHMPWRHVFFRCGRQMLLIFKPSATEISPAPDVLPVPPHGARGPCHVCFAASGAEIAQWRLHLEKSGVGIESDFEWPGGGRSIYFRDPAGNSLEFAEPRIWKLAGSGEE
jgi:catechol 2,3-dioxygenase-like lactoylglutathione lyase family enzyme